MRCIKSISGIVSSIILCAHVAITSPTPSQQLPLLDVTSHGASTPNGHNVSSTLFAELEEFARLVDIAYCVGLTGIQAPFECVSRCDEFPGYHLVDTWNTGPLMSDSCGYLALDHKGKRIIVAFRGTYSITNTIVDLTTLPQEYVPYPGDPDEDLGDSPESYSLHSWPWKWIRKLKHRLSPRPSGNSFQKDRTREDKDQDRPEGPKCRNCTVHMGFFASWKDCRRIIIPHLEHLKKHYPHYDLYLVGHSLGGAVAALAALETDILGWNPTVTTFGEPRIGNEGLRDYLDDVFQLKPNDDDKNETSPYMNSGVNASRYRRMTHANDPVPLLPLTEWGFKMHSGEIYISKPDLQPTVSDLRLCDGDEDLECIFGAEVGGQAILSALRHSGPTEGAGTQWLQEEKVNEDIETRRRWGLPARYRMWQLFFAHRDYFWRLGLCVPGGDPLNWGRRYDGIPGRDGEEQRDL